MCDQQRFRSAYAYTQSDQSLCWSLDYSMSSKLLTEHQLEFLNLNEGYTGSLESFQVKVLDCRKPHAKAQLSIEIACCYLRGSRKFFQRGSKFDNVFFNDKGIEDPNIAINVPSSAFSWRADDGPILNAGLVALGFFRGS